MKLKLLSMYFWMFYFHWHFEEVTQSGEQCRETTCYKLWTRHPAVASSQGCPSFPLLGIVTDLILQIRQIFSWHINYKNHLVFSNYASLLRINASCQYNGACRKRAVHNRNNFWHSYLMICYYCIVSFL
jgi:hypothetical protein